MTAETGKAAPFRCANHPNTETHLSCSRCGKPICVRCVIQTPVGGRCRECAALKRPPLFQVGPRRFAKAAAYGVVAALVGGFLWAQVGSSFGLSWLLLVLLGYVVGEAVSRGADGRISRGLAVLAGGLTVLAALAGQVAMVMTRLPASLPLAPRLEAAVSFGVAGLFGNLMGLLFLVLAVVVATGRVR